MRSKPSPGILVAPLLMGACTETVTNDNLHLCWDGAPVLSDLPSDEVVETWNRRSRTGTYGNAYDATPFPDGSDAVVLGEFSATGRTWTVEEEESNAPHDGFSAAKVGCFSGERLLVEGTTSIRSVAGLFDATALPLILDAPRAGDGPSGLYPGQEVDGVMEYLDPLDVGPRFGTVITVGSAVAEADWDEAGFNDWKAEAIWSLHIEYGDVPGRVVVFAYDPEFAADPSERDRHYATPLDGIFDTVE